MLIIYVYGISDRCILNMSRVFFSRILLFSLLLFGAGAIVVLDVANSSYYLFSYKWNCWIVYCSIHQHGHRHTEQKNKSNVKTSGSYRKYMWTLHFSFESSITNASSFGTFHNNLYMLNLIILKHKRIIYFFYSYLK